MWPAWASARAVIKPKPEDAPVTRMTCLVMTRFLRCEVFGGSEMPSDDPAIGAQRLAVDPDAVRAGKEGDRGGDVLGLAEPFEWGRLGQAVDHLLWLAVEEQPGGGRSRRDRVNGDVAAAQFLGEHTGHRLDR